MSERWRVADFLDLEYFFIQGRKLTKEQGEGVLRERDRTLYLDEIKPDGSAGEAPEREWLIWRWLQVRRDREQQTQPETLLPGAVWDCLNRVGPLVVFLVMTILGAGSAYSALNYFGKEPVNVSLFFLLFIAAQVVILFLVLFFWVLRRFKGHDLRSASFLSWFNKKISLFFKPGNYDLDNSRRQEFSAVLAMVQARGRGYGSLFFWFPFKLLQISGIAFNLGLLGALLLKVAFTDLAFGWQSTIQLSAEFVSTFVQWVAWPWSWLLGASAYPDPAQIEGSRIVLKEGMYHLANADLASWWPFLCLAIVCYCLLPRVFLLLAGSFVSRRALTRVSFKRADYKQLLHRLLTPRLEVGVRKQNSDSIPSGRGFVPGDVGSGLSAEELPGAPLHGTLMALVPDELYADCGQQKLDLFCRQAFAYEVGELFQIDEDDIDHSSIFARVKNFPDGFSALLVLQEAWQPPIQEMLLFLRELRKLCGAETHILIALVGKPEAETIFTKVCQTDLLVWQQKTAGLGDLCLQVSPLVVE